MNRVIRNQIDNRVIDALFQKFVDDEMSEEGLLFALWHVRHPVVGKKPRDCSPEELVKIERCLSDKIEAIKKELETQQAA